MEENVMSKKDHMKIEVIATNKHKNVVNEENCFVGCTSCSVDVNDLELEVITTNKHKNVVNEENCFIGCTSCSVDVNNLELEE